MIARSVAAAARKQSKRTTALLRSLTSAQSSAMAEPLVLSKVQDGIGEIVLNRPRALNSLNLEMMHLMYDTYKAWIAPGSGVRAILLTGAGGKAFCAGGDVKHVAQLVMAGKYDAAMAFFKQEYLTDAVISQLSIPHISLLDGITMGGGAGVSMHGHFRVATERTMFAMPECAIGLFPDVGMMAHLPRLPAELGAYLSLTGARLTGIEVKEAGLATHYIPSSHLPLIRQHLQQAGPAAADLSHVNSILTDIEAQAAAAAAGQSTATCSSLSRRLPVIARCFGKKTVSEVVDALKTERAEQEFCREALQQLHRGSPLSAAVSLEYYHRSRAQGMSPVDSLEIDAILCGHFMAGDADFAEGVRARLIDKDDKPQWKHTSHNEVSPDLVRRLFEPRNPGDVLDLHQALEDFRRPLTSKL